MRVRDARIDELVEKLFLTCDGYDYDVILTALGETLATVTLRVGIDDPRHFDDLVAMLTSLIKESWLRVAPGRRV